MSKRAIFAATLWIAACLTANLALAQQPAPADDFTLKLALRDIEVISAALTNMPWKDVNQTIGKLQQQIGKQQQDAQAARDAKLIEDAKVAK